MASVSFSCIAVCVLLLAALGGAALARAPRLRVTRSEPGESEDMKIIRECNDTSPISRDAMNMVLINKHLYGNEASNFKCFLHCLYTKYNWMDDVGGFRLPVMQDVLTKSHLSPLVVETILFKCSAIPSPDKCERAYHFTECFWAETDKYPEQEEASRPELSIFDY